MHHGSSGIASVNFSVSLAFLMSSRCLEAVLVLALVNKMDRLIVSEDSASMFNPYIYIAN